jgi:hypothetical protein
MFHAFDYGMLSTIRRARARAVGEIADRTTILRRRAGDDISEVRYVLVESLNQHPVHQVGRRGDVPLPRRQNA